jgi:cytochrome c oxidase subunit 2
MAKSLFSIGFQDAATPFMEGIVDLHNYIFFYLILVLVFVFWMFFAILRDFFRTLRHPWHPQYLTSYRKSLLLSKNVVHGTILEIVWTITPSIILILIAIPSFGLLYAMDEILDPAITFKAIGHQWYWSYEYSDNTNSFNTDVYDIDLDKNNVIFDSNLVYQEELKLGEARLLTTDNSVVVPCDTHIRVIITSLDVLHSWAVPALGVKVDAVPGRLNQAFLFIKREGVFYGQCSELCGVNHGFMPIVIKAVSNDDYTSWIKNKIL